MISGTRYRRRRALVWAACISVVLNVAILVVLLHGAKLLWGAKRGADEKIKETTMITIEKRPLETPAPPQTPAPPVPQKTVQPVVKPVVQPPPQPQQAAPPAQHELSKETANAPPQPTAPPKPTTLQARLAADQQGFANTVSKLNAQNNVHAIPTIDPSTQGGTVKSYSFRVPGGHSSSEGYGTITDTQSWHEHGLDCYYGRYEFTYPDGAEESGSIVWPFCYDPGSDPFKQGRHELLFPFPVAGFRLPAGTTLPPLEKQAYDEWLSQQ
jgi:hypothetical protein